MANETVRAIAQAAAPAALLAVGLVAVDRALANARAELEEIQRRLGLTYEELGRLDRAAEVAANGQAETRAIAGDAEVLDEAGAASPSAGS